MKIGLITMIAIVITFCSCSKKVDPAPVKVTGNNFTWAYRGSSYSADISIANLYSMAPKPIIVAYNKTNVPFPNYKLAITVISFNVGSYTLSGSSNSRNSFYYVDNDGHELLCKGGSLIITANSNNLISGNFSVSVIDPFKVTRTITGSFTNTPIEI